MIFIYLKNCVEIGALSSFFYVISLWLKKDTDKNLLGYFYLYLIAFLVSWHMNLLVISSFMLYTSPLILIIFTIFHQDILQRNFISMKKEAPKTKNHEYLEELLRAALATLNANKNFYAVIAYQSDIKPFVTYNFLLNADISQECISYITSSDHFDENKFLWCSHYGQLIALNAQWKFHTTSHSPAAAHKPGQWKEDAILITSKTDACVINGNPTTRLFDLVARGKLYEQLSSHQLLQMLKMQFTQSPLIGDKIYESSQRITP